MMVPLLQIFWVFFKIGFLFFGGGYAAIPVMKSEVVDRLGWLSQNEFLNALAAGQVTPGPVAITATFIGYRVGGFPGAVLGTLGMFLPSFCIMLILSAFFCRFCEAERAGKLGKVVLPAVAGLLVAMVFQMGQTAFTSAASWLIGGVAFAAALWERVDYGLLVLLAAGAGYLIFAFF